jgi:hypothetical protein
MGATLDLTRPYGTVHGGGYAAAFEQDGKEFDASGKEIVRAAVKAKAASAPSANADAGTPSPVTKDAQGNLFRDGEILDTDDMTVETLHVLAKDMGLRLHPQTGKAKVLAAIIEAAGPVDQLATQLDN